MPKPAEKNPTQLDSFRRIRAMEIWRLKTVLGMGPDEIAARLGVSPMAVEANLRRIGTEITRQYEPKTKQYFEAAIAQMDYLICILAKRIEDSELLGRVDMQAVQQYRQTSESLRKLLGLDRDKARVEISGPEGGPVKLQAVSDSLAELARQRLAKRDQETLDALEVDAREVVDEPARLRGERDAQDRQSASA